jgi:hypothetical protein
MIIFKEIKVKYEYLDVILEEHLRNIRYSNNVNVIIDLKEVVRKVYRPDILDENSITNETIEELSSDIIGIAAHYRNYFYKNGKYSSIFFFYSGKECSIMKAKFPDYKKEYYQKYLYDPERAIRRGLIEKAVNISDKIINKVPNCQFIDSSDYDEFVMTKFLVQQIPKNEFTLILSNDEVMAQLISSNVSIINMKSTNSDLLTETNAVSKIFKKDTNISSKLVSLVSALIGTQHYSLYNIPNVGPHRAIKAVEHLLNTGKIMDTEYITFPIKVEKLDAKNTIEKMLIEHYDGIKKNYEIIRADDVLHSNQTNIKIKFNKPIQTYSTNYFLELNAKVFTNHPISIDMLLKGEV